MPRPQSSPTALCLVLLLAAPAAAQDAAPEAPAQEQAAPVTLPPGGYHTPDEILAQTAALDAEDGVTVRELGRSAEGRPLLVVGLGERGQPGRPAVLVVADPDGTKPSASQVAFELVRGWAGEPGGLLDRATVYVVPVANPDAAAHLLEQGLAWRGAPNDDDRDGRLDEDPAEDLDGDGRVLQMRVADPAGDWMADPEEPRWLRAPDRTKGERGGWRLLPEGVDEDGDRAFNEDGPGGIRLEANWPHRWREHAPDSGAWPLSESFQRALADFVLERPNIAVVVVLGQEDNLAAPPKGSTPDAGSTDPPAGDAALLKLLGDRLHEGQEHRPRSAPHGAGGFADWCGFQAGRLVLESALWSPPVEAGERLEAALLAWDDATHGGAGFVEWADFDHPQLGPVQIGGWLPVVRDNPPAEELPALVTQWRGFLDGLAGDLPDLEWVGLEVTDRGEGVREARATLLNPRLLPTMTEMGETTRRLLPVFVRLELPEGGVLLGGRAEHSVSRLAGSGGKQEFRWLYRVPAGAAPAVLVAESHTAGRAEVTLEVQG
jgi:hypothetical protein